MQLKHLLSLITAAMTVLGAILYSIGSQHTALAVGLWLAALFSLVFTDFLGLLRLPRNAGLVIMWAALAWFLPQFVIQATLNGRVNLGHSPDWQLQTVANILICLQFTLLFQEKDARTYGWLILMSLLQVVVAARYSRGAGFGSLLVAYGAIGLLGMSLLALYANRGRGERESHSDLRGGRTKKKGTENTEAAKAEVEQAPAPQPRWPLAKVESHFTSMSPVGGRSGIVPELFARLALLIVGATFLAAVIFYTIPRPGIRAWRGEFSKKLSVVGFNDQIALGSLGETIESREEVMRVHLIDPETGKPFPLTDEIYLRGAAVTWYVQNHWRRAPEGPWSITELKAEADPSLQLGRPVIQKTTLEPFVDRDDLFYIWPFLDKRTDKTHELQYERASEHLSRVPDLAGDPRTAPFTYEVRTTGLVEGAQAALVPARRRTDVAATSPLLELPRGRDALPRLVALAEKWRKKARLKPDQHYEIAHHFERQLASSGDFHYSLQGQPRDESIDAIDDFVSDHPQGNCEYFATALALMLRSQGIPSRVVLGYRCDEWDPEEKCFQVRQLHAHAWVEAYFSPEHLPEKLSNDNPERWRYGGWQRFDGTPAADVGSAAANRTAWGAWEAKLHGMEHYWESCIADMDRTKQQESVYEPLRRALGKFARGLVNPAAWRETIAAWWATLARAVRSGIMGKLFVAVLGLAVAGAIGMCGWGLARLARCWWRRWTGQGGSLAARGRSSVEFYHRFEQIAARQGLLRGAGQTPREFAGVAGAKLATVGGRPELRQRAMQVADAFYRVRFGQQALDTAAAADLHQALEELKAVE